MLHSLARHIKSLDNLYVVSGVQDIYIYKIASFNKLHYFTENSQLTFLLCFRLGSEDFEDTLSHSGMFVHDLDTLIYNSCQYFAIICSVFIHNN